MNPSSIIEVSSIQRWRFQRVGGIDQVVLESGADLLQLGNLDQKLWVALSCPTQGLEFDEDTLGLIDSDDDGRIRPPELLAAIQWAASRLTDPDVLLSENDALPLAAISDVPPAGASLVAAARRILKSLNKPDADSISVGESSRAASLFAKLPFNGDGVIPPSAATDEEIKLLITEIYSTVGGVSDRSGEAGVSARKLEEFFQEIAAFASWWEEGDAESARAERLPLGDQTPEGYQILLRVRGKIDDYFSRCRLCAYDSRATGHLNRPESDYVAVAGENLATIPIQIRDRPLAKIEAGRPLSLAAGVNPAWESEIAIFRQQVVNVLLEDKAELLEEDWLALKEKFANYDAWIGAKRGASVEKLGIVRINTILKSEGRAGVQALIDRDLRRSGEAAALQDLDRLTRYHRDLFKLVRNFVSFSDFFSQEKLAIFQAGTLFLDSRSCELCVQVNDPNAHSVLGNLSRCFMAYCECRRAGGEFMRIAAVFSNGDSDNLMVGRNGVFYDRKGRDWDATIVRILDNPISIRQAFWSPYKKFVRFVDDQLAKRAALADEAATRRMATAAETTAHVDRTVRPAQAPRRIEVGTVAAIGVALGSIGTFLTMILIRMIDFGPWLPLAFVGIVLLISGPSMFLAWIKLRQRTLGPILDANGWAVNGRVRIGVALARSLTGIQRLPPGSTQSLPDSFQLKRLRARRIRWLLGVLALAVAAFVYINYRDGGFPFSSDDGETESSEPIFPSPGRGE